MLRRELTALEIDPRKGKVDHPTSGSKDCADAVAAICWNLGRSSLIRIEHNVEQHGGQLTATVTGLGPPLVGVEHDVFGLVEQW